MIQFLMRLIAWVVPPESHDWASAMRAEIASIADPAEARRFARGCLWAACRFRLRALVCVSPRAPAPRDLPVRLLFVQLHCACAASAIGVAYLVLASAPRALVVVNTVASLLGVLLVAASQRLRGMSPRLVTVATIAIAATLLLTAVCGHAVDGAARWVPVGPMFVQTSLVFLPTAVLLFAQTVNRWTTTAMILVAIAVALQPDRAMAFALCTGLLVLLAVRRTRADAIAAGSAGLGVLATWLRADRLPAVPFVDHILWSSFDVHPFVGLAVWLGSALLFVPMLLGRSAAARQACLACGACWAAIVASAAVGAYPTPVVGYGGAAILGYFLSIAVLGAQATVSHATADGRAGIPHQTRRQVDGASDIARASGDRGSLGSVHAVRAGSRARSA